MSKSTFRIIVFDILLASLVLSPAIISARAAPTSYLPGVHPGDWAKYKVLYNSCTGSAATCQNYGPGSLSDSDYGLLQVVGVSPPSSVTLGLTSVYKNGTSSHLGTLVDVSSGAVNGSGVGGGPGDYFVLATGLNAPDPIWISPNAPTLNTTRPEMVLGSTRDVNFLNYTFSSTSTYGSISSSAGFAFDKLSGVFVEVSISYTTTGTISGDNHVAFAIGMVDNNIWLPSHLPDYHLNANPPTVNVAGTAFATATITPTRSYGFSAEIDLKATTSDPGLTCTLSSSSLSMTSSDASTLSCSGSPGSYTVAIQGNGSFIIRTATVTVNIAAVANPDFQIASSGGMSFQAGNSGTATITITAQNGYSGSTSLEVSSSPSGLTCNLSKNSVSGSGTSTLTCSGQPGTYTVIVKATGGRASHSAPTTVTVTAAPVSTPTPSQPASSLPTPLVYGGIAVALVAAALIALLLFRRKPGEPMIATGDAATPATQA